MKINTNNFFSRFTKKILPHFKTINFDQLPDHKISKLSNWIYNNCVGRFTIIDDIDFSGETTKRITKIGFEEHSDLTLFILSDPTQIMSK